MESSGSYACLWKQGQTYEGQKQLASQLHGTKGPAGWDWDMEQCVFVLLRVSDSTREQRLAFIRNVSDRTENYANDFFSPYLRLASILIKWPNSELTSSRFVLSDPFCLEDSASKGKRREPLRVASRQLKSCDKRSQNETGKVKKRWKRRTEGHLCGTAAK